MMSRTYGRRSSVRAQVENLGRLLDRFPEGSHAYSIKREVDGFTLVGEPDRVDEFSDLVREGSEKAGDDFIVFTTSDGHHGYSQMFVMPLDEAAAISADADRQIHRSQSTV